VAEAVEWHIAITPLVVGASHVARLRDWAEAFRQLHRCGRPGARANGVLSLVPRAAIVAGRGSRAWPGAVPIGFGWLLVARGLVCLLAPEGPPVNDSGRRVAPRVRGRGDCVVGRRRMGVLLPLAPAPRGLTGRHGTWQPRGAVASLA
jgi:hypothetical protein